MFWPIPGLPPRKTGSSSSKKKSKEFVFPLKSNRDVAFVDQGYTGYTGEEAKQAAQEQGIELVIVKHTEVKKGFVVLPKRWVIERSVAWTARFRRLARDYERLPKTLAGLHFVVFAGLMLVRVSAKGLLQPHLQAVSS